MTRVILNGCCGKMGKVISQSSSNFSNLEIVAGIDKFGDNSPQYPVFKAIEDCNVEADVVLDFSRPDALNSLLNYCKNKNLPIVLCTTGYSEEEQI
jgi:4-hydroxy-tetrahydrodipicolinate reductase